MLNVIYFVANFKKIFELVPTRQAKFNLARSYVFTF